METFFLGVPDPASLARASVPLFLSRHRLVLRDGRQRKTLPRSRVAWALDSGGFTTLSQHGRYLVTHRQYAEEVCRYDEQIGNLRVAFAMDWMCEPSVIAMTGLSVEEHQRRTIESIMVLRELAPGLPWAPVLQGWTLSDYERHVALYLRNGIDLRCEPLVGVGSVCTRSGAAEGLAIARLLASFDLRLHLFGYKRDGLPDALPYCVSADSMAWSQHARNNNERLPGCTHRYREDGRYERDLYDAGACASTHGANSRHGEGCVILRRAGELHHRKGDLSDCRNCFDYAEDWARKLVELTHRKAGVDELQRFWGFSVPSAKDIAEWSMGDRAEVDGPPGDRLDALEGDWSRAAERVSALSGVSVGSEPISHFIRVPGAPCESARYAPPGRWAAARPDPTPPPIEGLPAPSRDRPARRAFRPWTPPLRLVPGGLLPVIAPGRPRLVPRHARAEAQDIAGRLLLDEVWVRLAGPEIGPGVAWEMLLPHLESSGEVIALRARAVAEGRSQTDRDRMLRAIREGIRDRAWAELLVTRPQWGVVTRPDLRPSKSELRERSLGAPPGGEDLDELRSLARDEAARVAPGLSARRLRGRALTVALASDRSLALLLGGVGGALHPRSAGRRDAMALMVSLRQEFKARGVVLPSDAALRSALGIASQKVARKDAKKRGSRR